MIKKHTLNSIVIIFSFSIILTLINYIWIKNNLAHIPPPWDTAWYLYMSLNDYDALVSGNFFHFIKTLIEQDPYHAPFFPATGILSFIIFGPNINTAYLINAIYLFILISSVFFITERLAGKRAAILSAFFVSTFPAVIGFSRDYLFEFPLAALTALSYLFLIRSDSFRNSRDSILFGICSGLSVLTKTMGIVFFVMPFFYTMYVFIKDKDSKTVRKNIIFSFITALLVASLFYVPNFKNIFGYLFGFGFGEASKPYSFGIPSILSIQNWTIYLKAITLRGISISYTLIFLISAIIYLFIKGKKLSKDYLILWLWFIFGYFLLSLPTAKGGERFALPILSPLAIIMAIHIINISLKPLRYSIIGLAVAIGIMNYAYQTGSEYCQYKQFSYKATPILLPIHITCFVKDIDDLAVPYDKDWNIMPILQYMDSFNDGDLQPITILVGFDHYFLNCCTIQLYAKLGRLKGMLRSNFIIEGLANKQLAEDEIKGMMEKSHFIVTKTGFQGPGFSNVNNSIVKNILRNKIPPKSFAMSDGSIASVYPGDLPIRWGRGNDKRTSLNNN